MSLQEIIAFILIGIAGFFTIRWIYRMLFPKQSGCDSCASSSCGGCPLEDLKQEIEEKKKNQS